jgi:hypothetical protein
MGNPASNVPLPSGRLYRQFHRYGFLRLTRNFLIRRVSFAPMHWEVEGANRGRCSPPRLLLFPLLFLCFGVVRVRCSRENGNGKCSFPVANQAGCLSKDAGLRLLYLSTSHVVKRDGQRRPGDTCQGPPARQDVRASPPSLSKRCGGWRGGSNKRIRRLSYTCGPREFSARSDEGKPHPRRGAIPTGRLMSFSPACQNRSSGSSHNEGPSWPATRRALPLDWAFVAHFALVCVCLLNALLGHLRRRRL